MEKQAGTGDTVLVKSRDMKGRRQTLPCMVAGGGGVKTTENKIHWPPFGVNTVCRICAVLQYCIRKLYTSRNAYVINIYSILYFTVLIYNIQHDKHIFAYNARKIALCIQFLKKRQDGGNQRSLDDL
jgi:hypothetical protein